MAEHWSPPADMALPVLNTPKTSDDVIIDVNGLKKYYEVQGNSLKDTLGFGEPRYVKAVEDASFQVRKGRTLGIVGESGCGKSTLIKTIIGLEEAPMATLASWALILRRRLRPEKRG